MCSTEGFFLPKVINPDLERAMKPNQKSPMQWLLTFSERITNEYPLFFSPFNAGLTTDPVISAGLRYSIWSTISLLKLQQHADGKPVVSYTWAEFSLCLDEILAAASPEEAAKDVDPLATQAKSCFRQWLQEQGEFTGPAWCMRTHADGFELEQWRRRFTLRQ